MPASDIKVRAILNRGTGIESEIFNEIETHFVVYDFKGVKLMEAQSLNEVRQKLGSGLYIINNKKIYLK